MPARRCVLRDMRNDPRAATEFIVATPRLVRAEVALVPREETFVIRLEVHAGGRVKHRKTVVTYSVEQKTPTRVNNRHMHWNIAAAHRQQVPEHVAGDINVEK